MEGHTTLKALGVDPDQELLYRVLLARPGASASELREATSFSARRLQRHLVELERKAMVTRRGGGTHPRFQPTPAEIVIDALFSAREDELQRARLDAHAEIDLLRPAVDQLHVTELVEILSSREALAERWTQLQQSARKTLDIFTRPPLAQASPEEHESLQASLRERGVVVRGLYDEDGVSYPGAWEHVRHAVSHGERVRVVSRLPLKLAIVDRRTALVPVGQYLPSGIIDGGVLVHESALLDALMALFDIYWEQGTPANLSDDTHLSETHDLADESAVLTLLASGLKDEAIARQLDLSVTTVRRRITMIQERLGVTSRFQVGLALGRQGWASPGAEQQQLSQPVDS